MTGERGEQVDDENVPLLLPTEYRMADGNNLPDRVGGLSESNLNSGRRELRAVDAEADYGVDTFYQNIEAHQQHSGAGTNSSSDGGESMVARGGPTVTCRICDAEILLEGRNTHVVRCQQCNEVTPIRAAPPGKKYVRCPCNCLLICKASSNRIACPRPNCRRVITLVASASVGTAVRAPAGTCRVQCFHCGEMFMFNTLTNTVAHCPHCKKASSVGVTFARSRALIYSICFTIVSLILLGVVLGTINNGNIFVYTFWVVLAVTAVVCLQRLIYFLRLKVSQVLGPI